ncbi:MAG: hypothetical protein WDZ88_02795 [Candidatus Paceibacterota bacterium]
MVTKELLEYIKLQYAKGYTLTNIRNALRAGGWNTEDLNQATTILKDILVPQKRKPFFNKTATFSGDVGTAVHDKKQVKAEPWSPAVQEITQEEPQTQPQNAPVEADTAKESFVSPSAPEEPSAQEPSVQEPQAQTARAHEPEQVQPEAPIHETAEPVEKSSESPVSPWGNVERSQTTLAESSSDQDVSVTGERKIQQATAFPNPNQIEPEETVLEFIERMKRDAGVPVTRPHTEAHTHGGDEEPFKINLNIPPHLRNQEGASPQQQNNTSYAQSSAWESGGSVPEEQPVTSREITPLTAPAAPQAPRAPRAPQAQKTAEHTTPPTQDNSKHSVLLLFIIIFVIIMGAGAAYAYVTYFSVPKTFSWAEMAEQVASVRSGNIDAEVAMSVVGDDNFSGSVNLQGYFDIHDIKNPLLDLLVAGNIEMVEPRSRANISLNASLPARVVDNTLYAQMSDIPSVVGFDFSFIGDSWVVFNLSEAISSRSEEIQALDTTNEKELRGRLWELFKQHPMLTVIGGPERETIKGISMYRFEVTPDYEQIEIFSKKVIDVFSEYYPEQTEEIHSSLPVLSAKDFENENIVSQKYKIWVGQKSGMLHRVLSETIVRLPEAEASRIENSFGVQGDIAVLNDVFLSDINDRRSVEVPSDTVLFEEVMSQLFTPVFPVDQGSPF